MKTIISNNISENGNRVNNTLPAWCKNGQHVLFEGRLHVIECAPKKEYEHLHEVIIEDCETHHCHFENWDNLTPCTPDGRDLLPEPPKEIIIEDATLEPASEITEFFTKGKKYRCIKSVKGDFTKGKVYEQSSDPTQWYGYFRNDKGVHHVWPQPAQIDHSCELYDMKPEDVDPRLYFEPVGEITEAEGVKIGDKVRHNLTGDRVATVTGIRRVQGYKWEGEITVYRLDFGESVKGPCGMEMNGGEYQREAFTPCEASDTIESRKRTIIARAKQDKQAWHYYKGYEVRVRKAYTNGSKEPENWTYCVSWYADGQLVECENGVRLEQAARALNDLPQWAEARKAA